MIFTLCLYTIFHLKIFSLNMINNTSYSKLKIKKKLGNYSHIFFRKQRKICNARKNENEPMHSGTSILVTTSHLKCQLFVFGAFCFPISFFVSYSVLYTDVVKFWVAIREVDTVLVENKN